VEDVFFQRYAAEVDLDIDEAGVDSVDGRAVSFEKHDGWLQRV
jgi:hypothetical protein